MKTVFLLIICPLLTWAQPGTIPPLRSDALKLIGSDQIPTYSQYGYVGKTQYTYDGLDIKAKDLAPYFMASGSPEAIQEFKSYMGSRHAGGWLIAGGVTSAIIGAIVMGSNGPGSNGKFTAQQPYVCPSGYACGRSSGGLVYGGQIAGYQTVTDVKRQSTYSRGGVMLLGGALLAGIGWGMQMPGQHMRRATQYYNRALKHQGISWRLQPYSMFTNAGVGLVGKF